MVSRDLMSHITSFLEDQLEILENSEEKQGIPIFVLGCF